MDKLPVVEKDFGEQARQDTEVAHGEDVDVDYMAQSMNNCSRHGNRRELVHRYW